MVSLWNSLRWCFTMLCSETHWFYPHKHCVYVKSHSYMQRIYVNEYWNIQCARIQKSLRCEKHIRRRKMYMAGKKKKFIYNKRFSWGDDALLTRDRRSIDSLYMFLCIQKYTQWYKQHTRIWYYYNIYYFIYNDV